MDIGVAWGLDVDGAWELTGAFGDEREFEKLHFFFVVENRGMGRSRVVLWLWLRLREVAKEEGGGFGIVCAADGLLGGTGRGGDGGVWAVEEKKRVRVMVEWT